MKKYRMEGPVRRVDGATPAVYDETTLSFVPFRTMWLALTIPAECEDEARQIAHAYVAACGGEYCLPSIQPYRARSVDTLEGVEMAAALRHFIDGWWSAQQKGAKP